MATQSSVEEGNKVILLEILDSIKRIEENVHNIKRDVDILKSQFERDDTSVADDVDSNELLEDFTLIARANQTPEKTKLLENPDYRGPRTLDLGWVWDDKRLTLVERYHTMFQLLNKIEKGDDAEELSESQLSDLRKRLLKIARAVRNIIYADFPGIRYFTELLTSDQHYYQLVLEEKVSTYLEVNICLCKDMWCARTLLRESFKSGNRGLTTMQDIAREKVKRRRHRENEILREKARAKRMFNRLDKGTAVKLEPEGDPDYLALMQAVKSEAPSTRRLRSSK